MEERERPGLPPWWFLLVVFALGLAVAAATIVLGTLRDGSTHAEGLYRDGGGAWGILHGLVGLESLRVLVGIAAGATVTATGFVARRFTHSAGLGVLAAVLVAFDPALLVDGQLAVPAALLRFAAVAAMALALGGHPAYHWLVALPIIVGAILEPWFLLWGVMVSTLLLLRGHIFAAPKHLRDAMFQGVGLPLLAGIPLLIAVHQITVTTDVVCGPSMARSLLLLDVPLYATGLAAIMNPVVVIGGLGLLAGLAVAAIVQVSSAFRLARLPGRVQIRLPERLGRIPSRALWLAAFALVMPVPQVAIVIGALAIALGVQGLLIDSPVFATVVAILTASFAAVVVVRLLPVIAGDASAAVLGDVVSWLPWVDLEACVSEAAS